MPSRMRYSAPKLNCEFDLEIRGRALLLALVVVGRILDLEAQPVDRRPPLHAAEDADVLAVEEGVGRELAALAEVVLAVAEAVGDLAERVADRVRARQPSPAEAGGDGEVLDRLGGHQVFAGIDAGAEEVAEAERDRRGPGAPLALAQQGELHVEAAVEEVVVGVVDAGVLVVLAPVVDGRVADGARDPRQDLEAEVPPLGAAEIAVGQRDLRVGLVLRRGHVDQAGHAVEVEARPHGLRERPGALMPRSRTRSRVSASEPMRRRAVLPFALPSFPGGCFRPDFPTVLWLKNRRAPVLMRPVADFRPACGPGARHPPAARIARRPSR